MSNKDVRTPANPGYSPGVDTSTSAARPLPLGAGRGLPDMRQQVAMLHGPGADRESLSDDEVLAMLADCDRFLWQLVTITSRVLETVEIGDVRRLVAADMAMPADVVLGDGTIQKSRTAPVAPAKSRGPSHPLVVLLKLTVQAIRLIKQISQGTHPEAHNRRRRSAEEESTIAQVDRTINSVFKKYGVT
jgi:hypothetical protein